MKEHERINHRGHRGGKNISLCSLKEYPLQDITREIISCCIEVYSILKAMSKRVGLLINLNVLRLKEGIKRLIL